MCKLQKTHEPTVKPDSGTVSRRGGQSDGFGQCQASGLTVYLLCIKTRSGGCCSIHVHSSLFRNMLCACGLSHTLHSSNPHPLLLPACVLLLHPIRDVRAQSDRKSAGVPKSGAHIRRNALRHHGSISVGYGRTAACTVHRLPVSSIELFDTGVALVCVCIIFFLGRGGGYVV